MRADAVRNHDRILRATVDLVLEQGPSTGMEAIARRAGVGGATVYRHFPDRASLLTQVQLECLTAAADEAEAALTEERDAFAALARYMHKAVELRVSAVMPLLNERVIADEELLAARRRGRAAIDSLVDRAHREGALRPEVTTGDISMLIIRVSRPVPGITATENLELSHRHLEILLNGFLNVLGDQPLPGPTISIDQLATSPARNQ